MNDLKYEPVELLDRERLLLDLNSNDPDRVSKALYSACRTESDTEWLENICIDGLDSAEPKVRWAAATCLGDLALFRHKLNIGRVVPALEKALDDSTISGPARVSLDMVNEFSARLSGQGREDSSAT